MGHRELAVHVVQEAHVFDTQGQPGSPLLGLPNPRNLAARNGGVRAPGIPIGDDAIGHGDPGIGP